MPDSRLICNQENTFQEKTELKLKRTTALCRLGKNVITPTTKAADHDVPISPEDIVAKGLMTQQQWDQVFLDQLK